MKRKSISRPVKRTPQRTCVACRQVKLKRDLVRLVSVPGETVEIDATGKKTGRGAYLCPALECWETGLKSGRLEYALRTSLTRENREQLVKLGQELLKERVSGYDQ
ncbi:MAG TPA: YlxR family protein [Dehalococcoidales bacterium]